MNCVGCGANLKSNVCEYCGRVHDNVEIQGRGLHKKNVWKQTEPFSVGMYRGKDIMHFDFKGIHDKSTQYDEYDIVMFGDDDMIYIRQNGKFEPFCKMEDMLMDAGFIPKSKISIVDLGNECYRSDDGMLHRTQCGRRAIVKPF